MVDGRKKTDNIYFRDALIDYSHDRVLKNEIPRTVLAERLAGGEDVTHDQNSIAFVDNIRVIGRELMEEATNGKK